jgi:hypothetical protein
LQQALSKVKQDYPGLIDCYYSSDEVTDDMLRALKLHLVLYCQQFFYDVLDSAVKHLPTHSKTTLLEYLLHWIEKHCDESLSSCSALPRKVAMLIDRWLQEHTTWNVTSGDTDHAERS